jgi:hypothetical protein
VKEIQRELPDHLTDNVSSKCLVFRHPNLFHRKSVVFSYAHNKDKRLIKEKAVAFAVKMNEALGPIPPTSPEGRMSSRNRSRIVGVFPRRTLAKRNGLFYFSWTAKWKGCPHKGGVSWPCISHTDNGAYVLAALTLKMRTINRGQVLEEFEKIKKKAEFKKILRLKPKIPIDKFWPE